MQFAHLHYFSVDKIANVKIIDYLCKLRNNERLWTILKYQEN